MKTITISGRSDPVGSVTVPQFHTSQYSDRSNDFPLPIFGPILELFQKCSKLINNLHFSHGLHESGSARRRKA